MLLPDDDSRLYTYTLYVQMVGFVIRHISYCMECMTLNIRLEAFSLVTSRILSGQTHGYFNGFLGEKNGRSGVVFGNVNTNLEQGLVGIDCGA